MDLNINKDDERLLKYGISGIRCISSPKDFGISAVFSFNQGDDFIIKFYIGITFNDIIDKLEKNHIEKIKMNRDIKINKIRGNEKR